MVDKSIIPIFIELTSSKKANEFYTLNKEQIHGIEYNLSSKPLATAALTFAKFLMDEYPLNRYLWKMKVKENYSPLLWLNAGCLQERIYKNPEHFRF